MKIIFQLIIEIILSFIDQNFIFMHMISYFILLIKYLIFIILNHFKIK